MLSMVLGALTAFSQSSLKNPDLVYGFDPLLYNGKVYAYYTMPGTEGTQYLFDTFDTMGSLTVRGVTFARITLNFDICNQQLIMKYKSTIGASSLIEISKAWLEKFEIDGRHFEIIATSDTTKEIYQVLGAGPSKIMYYQTKKLLLNTLIASKNYFFSHIQKGMYVFNGKQRIKYKNNRSFVAAFNPAQQDMIRKYIRKHKLIVQKVSDLQMTDLINYCNTLTGT